MQWTCEKQFNLQKTRSILKFFIDTFLDISTKCANFEWYRQSLLYLKQVKYLAIILRKHCAAFGDDAQEVLEEIKKREPRLIELMAQNKNIYQSPSSVTETVPFANGNAVRVNRPVSVKFEEPQLNHDKSGGTKQTTSKPKTPRKSVAFNFQIESENNS